MAMTTPDYYRRLGLERDASPEEIKRLPPALARCHPDITRDSSAVRQFQEIVEAYACLSDPSKRAQYDQRNPRRGADRRISMQIEIWEKYAGVVRTIPITTFDVCGNCRGIGRVGRTCLCPSCSGSVLLYSPRELPRDGSCSICQGFGILGKTCAACEGVGRQCVHHRLQLTLPRNIDDGALIRLTGAGDAGVFGGPRGDLYVKIIVLPLPERFRTRALGSSPPRLQRRHDPRQPPTLNRVFPDFAELCCSPVDFADWIDTVQRSEADRFGKGKRIGFRGTDAGEPSFERMGLEPGVVSSVLPSLPTNIPVCVRVCRVPPLPPVQAVIRGADALRFRGIGIWPGSGGRYAEEPCGGTRSQRGYAA